MVERLVNGAYGTSYLNIGKIRYSAIAQTNALSSEMPLPGGNVYSQGGGLTGLRMADWLGTERVAYGYTGGGYVRSGAHAPFGEAYDYPNDYPGEFTGQLDDGKFINATHYFPERQYRSSQGRWLSPDPAGIGAVDPSDPQSWNRYAYVRNSPLDHTDPEGLDDWGGDWGWGGGGWDWGGWGGGGGGGGWGGTLNISWGGGGVNVGFSGFGGGCSGESLGVPCGGSLNDPLAGQVALARQMIIAAVKGDWKAVLGLGLTGLEQNLIAQANEGNCEFGPCDANEQNIPGAFGFADSRPTCLGDVFLGEVKNALNPFSPSLGSLGDAATATVSRWLYNKAVNHAAARALMYPMKSSIVRRWLGYSKATAAAGALVTLDLALLQGVIVEANQAWKGQCRPGALIF